MLCKLVLPAAEPFFDVPRALRGVSGDRMSHRRYLGWALYALLYIAVVAFVSYMVLADFL